MWSVLCHAKEIYDPYGLSVKSGVPQIDGVRSEGFFFKSAMGARGRANQ